MTDQNPIQAAALELIAKFPGGRVLPLAGKIPSNPPCRNGLNDASSDPAIVQRWLENGHNFGIHLESFGWLVLDVDGDQGWESLCGLEAKYGGLPETRVVQTGTHDTEDKFRGAHYYFRNLGNRIRCGKLKDGHGDDIPGLEIKGAGGYVVGEGSRHVSGFTYEPEASALEAPADAPGWLLDLIEGRLAEPVSEQPTATAWTRWQDDITRKLAENGGRKYARGRNDLFINLACRWRYDDGADQCQNDTGHDAGEAPKAKPDSQPAWPEPCLPDMGVLPGFPLDALEDAAWFRAWVAGISEQYQTPIELAALGGLAGISAALSGRVIICQRGGWTEEPGLWVLCVAEPSERKSKVFEAATLPIADWESDGAVSTAAARNEIKAMREVLLAQIGKQKSASAAATGKAREFAKLIAALQTEIDELPSDMPVRLIYGDATTERFPAAVKQNGRVFAAADEAKLLKNLGGAYSPDGRTVNADIMLAGYSGSPYHRDRANESVSLRAVRIAMFLTIQPEMLRWLSTRSEFAGCGFLSRPLYAIPAPCVGRRRIGAPECPEHVRLEYARRIRELLDIPACETIPVIRFEQDALEVLQDFERRVEPRLHPDTGDLGGLSGWGGKLCGQTARIACSLHFAKHGAQGGFRNRISADTVRHAIMIAEWAVRHAMRAFSVMESNGRSGDCEYLIRIIRRERWQTFTRSEIYTPARGRFRHDVVALDKALELLELGGCVKRAPCGDNRGPGRPETRYVVNPKLLEGVQP
ncbi:MAG: DUF3987 domain-containing protein [Candidatus Sumerlaeota bacterium]|nr:DUF3987 domain-containing protein [Candidatus Sumerlaeota bacterium]